jgi:hypothetical protein
LLVAVLKMQARVQIKDLFKDKRKDTNWLSLLRQQEGL